MAWLIAGVGAHRTCRALWSLSGRDFTHVQPSTGGGFSSSSSAQQRWLSIGKNEWPRDWIRREERWIDMDGETQSLWRTLGWSEQLWTAHHTSKSTKAGGCSPRCPPIQRKKWAALRDSEREAAMQLGYCERLWEFEDKECASKCSAHSSLSIPPVSRALRVHLHRAVVSTLVLGFRKGTVSSN